MASDRGRGVEWPTLALIFGCHAVWAAGTTVVAGFSLWLAVPLVALSITLHSSLQHEVLHGHPFRSRRLNEALVALPVGLVFPYGRFRDLHLAHHRDEFLTDPYDDPESNFLDPAVWVRLPAPLRALLALNNTLLGRMVFGPALGTIRFLAAEARLMAAGDRAVRRDWLLHLAGLMPVAWWIAQSAMPVWAYALAAYGGLSVLKVRTYLEHRAHDRARGRSVVIERQGILSFLFLNNSFHAVHHARPGLAWYRLPALYAERREEFLRRNDGYVYASYGEVFRRHLLSAKDPVPHPLWPEPAARPDTAPAPSDGAQGAG